MLCFTMLYLPRTYSFEVLASCTAFIITIYLVFSNLKLSCILPRYYLDSIFIIKITVQTEIM